MDFGEVYCRGVDFGEVYCRGVDFGEVYCRGVDFVCLSAPGKLRVLAMFTSDRKRFLTRM